MAVTFNADEVLGIAAAIERNGVAFYRSAAEKVAAGDATKLLKELADWEMTHEATFTAMRNGLKEQEKESITFDPDNQAALYLQALADKTVFEKAEDPLKAMGKAPLLDAVLKEAVKREKDSIVFYVGMREVVPGRLGRERVDQIIKEEMRHVVVLTAELAKLKR